MSRSDLGRLPPLPQEGEFFRSSNQRRQAGFKRHLKPALCALFANDLVDRDGSCPAFERMWPKRLTRKKSFDESVDCGTHHHRIGLGNRLKARRNIGGVAECEGLVPLAGPHVAHHHLSGVHTDPQPNLRRVFRTRTKRRLTLGLPEPAVHLIQLSKNAQACFHGPYRGIFVGNRIAKIDQNPIAEILGDIAAETVNDTGTGLLIRPHDIPPLLGIKPTGEGR